MKPLLFIPIFAALLSCKTHKIKQEAIYETQIRSIADSLYLQHRSVETAAQLLNTVQNLTLTIDVFKDSIGHTKLQLHSTTQIAKYQQHIDTLQHTLTRNLSQQQQTYRQKQSFGKKEVTRHTTPLWLWLIILAIITIAYRQYKKHP